MSDETEQEAPAPKKKGPPPGKKPGQLVGQPGRRRDISDTPAINAWKTDVIDNRDPDFAYQFFRENQVRDKLHPTRLQLTDYKTGKVTNHDIPAWELCRRDTSGEELAGWRPDEGKPVDTLLRHGDYVAMRIPRWAWDLLQKAQEQRADGYERRLRGGRTEEFDISGSHTGATDGRLPAGNIRITEQPLARV